MLMTNPTDKLVNVNGINRFYTWKPGEDKDIPEQFVKAARAHGLVEAKAKTHKTTETPKIYKPKEAPKRASRSSFDVSIDSEFETKMILDQRATTVIGDLKEVTISKPDLQKLHDYEKSHRNDRKVLKYLTGRIR